MWLTSPISHSPTFSGLRVGAGMSWPRSLQVRHELLRNLPDARGLREAEWDKLAGEKEFDFRRKLSGGDERQYGAKGGQANGQRLNELLGCASTVSTFPCCTSVKSQPKRVPCRRRGREERQSNNGKSKFQIAEFYVVGGKGVVVQTSSVNLFPFSAVPPSRFFPRQIL